MNTVIKHCRGEKKEVKEKQMDSEKKPDDSRVWNISIPRIRSQSKNTKHICK